MKRTCVAVFVVFALAVVGSACSSDDDSSPDTTTTTIASTPLPDAFEAPTGPPCEADAEGQMVVTPDCVDPDISGAPYVDTDEQRTLTDPDTGVEVSFRYVHGGFTDSEVEFANYFPAPDAYQGRFFQWTYPISLPTLDDDGPPERVIAFGITNGAYLAWSNNAGGVAANPSLGGYRANAAAAKFSKVLAAEIYGPDTDARGYVFGSSGGAYQTLAAAENTTDIWAGSVPMVPGVPNSIPSFMSVQVLTLRILGDKLADVVDAMEPGGSGDPYATLTDEQAAILREATLMGHPLDGWWQWETLRGGAFGLVAPAVNGVDGSYVEDFFTLPGYEGTDPAVGSLRVQLDTTITAVEGNPPTAVTLADAPTGALDYVDLIVNPGTPEETLIPVVAIEGNQATLPFDADPEDAAALTEGAPVRVDNSFYIALSYYQRHQVPAPDQYGWDQYRDAAGAPIPPQREVLVGEVLSDVFGGKATGSFGGKMIMLSSVQDVQAFPWSADWYAGQAAESMGDSLDDNFRLWYMDNADHTSPTTTEGEAHIVSYQPEWEQALLDLDAWVADGTAPPRSSGYEMTDQNQVDLAESADDRFGVQPLVSLAVSAGDDCPDDAADVRAEVPAGDPVSFSLDAVAPPGAGEIIKVEWDYDSTGEFTDAEDVDPTGEYDTCTSHTYDETGTHFAVARVTLQRNPSSDDPFRQIQNLARVRVVVT